MFFFALYAAGGWSTILLTTSAADPAFLSLTGPQSEAFIFGYMALLIFGAAGQPQLITKFLMLRDKKELKWGASVSGIAYGVTTLFSLGIGLALKSMVVEGVAAAPETIDNTTTDFLANFTSPVVAGLALTALLAAVMSSASSFITIGAAAVVRDLASAIGAPVRRELLWSRVMSAVITVLAVLLVFYLSQAIFLLGAIGWAAFAAAILGPVGLGVYWKRATGAGTTAAVVVALGFNLLIVVLEAGGAITVPPHVHVGGVSLMLSLLAFVLVSLLTPQKNSQELFDQFDRGSSDAEAAPYAFGRLDEARTDSAIGSNRFITGAVTAVTVLAAVMLIGMVADLPDLIIYPVPILVGTLMLLGCASPTGLHRGVLAPIAGYTVVLLVVMTLMAATRHSTALLGGLPVATGILVYILWPFTVLTAGALYAWVYRVALSKDTENSPAATEQAVTRS
jgi:sodium/proline symporter